MQTADYRKEIEALMAAGDAAGAARQLSALWEREPGAGLAGFIASRFEKLRGRVPLVPYRWAVLRSFTVEPIVPILRASAFTRGIDLETYTGEFNAYAQEILDPESGLYRFRPDAVVLAVQTRDLAPDLWLDYARLTGAQCGDAGTRQCSHQQLDLGRLAGPLSAFDRDEAAALGCLRR